MKRRSVPLVLALVSLCSCDANGASDDFPRTDDPELAYVTRNGDNYGKSGINHSYESICRPFSKKRLSDGLANGHSMLLFLYSDSCIHCEEAHNDLTRLYLSSLSEVESVCFPSGDYSEVYNEFMSFVAENPGIAETIHAPILTPSIYLIKSEDKVLNLQFQIARETLQKLFDFFKSFINFTYVYSFRTYDSFVSFYKDNDCLVYVDKEDEAAPSGFYETIYPVAIHSDKKTAHIEWEYVSESDRTKFSSLLSNQVYDAKKGELTPIPSDTLTQDWITAYYA